MLPVLGKKAVLEWCMKEGLIGSSYVCPKCGKSMELREEWVYHLSIILVQFLLDFFSNHQRKIEHSLKAGRGVIDPPFQLTFFDDNIQWVSVVKYLGLHIDNRLTFKKHIDHLAEKFWGRIHLAISLVGRRSPLSLENKVILYKQVLRPIITYGSPVWGAAAATQMKKIQEDSLFHTDSSLKTFRDVKIHASKLRLLACRRSSNCNDLLPNMKTQRSAMSLKRLLPDTRLRVLRTQVPE
ncbi:RNA-directed DNA polymerase from mobile element jockey [Trichonephila clavipes]|nr:RNA-directed DNA polymerase from mobile element jockey [Trichonephila clavipes]